MINMATTTTIPQKIPVLKMSAILQELKSFFSSAETAEMILIKEN
jgi:hypothetical protein